MVEGSRGLSLANCFATWRVPLFAGMLELRGQQNSDDPTVRHSGDAHANLPDETGKP